VSERGSISGAAEFLKVNHSTVLRRLTSLEKRLGARLFDRLPDGYALTAQGDELRDRLPGVTEQIETAQRSLSGRDLGLSGALRILCLLADNERDLVLAEPLNELDTDLWILTHPALKGVARIKAFTAFLYEKLRASDKLFHASP
jgi:hypothetical protein